MVSSIMFSLPTSHNTHALNPPKLGQYVFGVSKKRMKGLHFKYLLYVFKFLGKATTNNLKGDSGYLENHLGK
jgi:hypothetical protein